VPVTTTATAALAREGGPREPPLACGRRWHGGTTGTGPGTGRAADGRFPLAPSATWASAALLPVS